MDDDLDELLDEVEKKFFRNDSTRSETRTDSSNTPKYPRENDNKQSAPEDIDALLEELLDDGSTRVQNMCDKLPFFQTDQIPKGSKVEGKSLTQSEDKKCRPVFLGGTSIPYGVGTLLSQRSCDQLRCTSCDFRILTFEDQEWDSACDYLFLRNNMPDGERLRAKLRRSKGKRAYACQCSWFSARDLADLGQQPQLRWVCGKHPA
ncbi:cilia- and flagella-associated protein 418 [Gadus macrocephalus]|uniref:cilia- and flagella-associated protein 418 n=1 Tax=Gadus macrocephalus TaxID=80720 RepID=UPI0028CBB09A|nr:cilia- and flagella-associated protein 418 [Gadus macrocephalus]